MYEMLAFSALHLSVVRPDRSDFYQQASASLQSKALSSLENTLSNVDENTCLPVLFFSHMIGIHSFCDTVALCNEPFSRFHRHLIATINLMRGVQAVILPWWNVLARGDMGKIMITADDRRSNAPKESLRETDRVLSLIHSADISEATVKVYETSLATLQVDFDEVRVTEGPLATTNTAFSWLVTCSSAYTKLLDEQRPEALVILAYYCVVLHRRRNTWIVGNAGKSVLTIILSYLGDRWDHILEWPKEEIFIRG